jgi:WD40 repeat protein
MPYKGLVPYGEDDALYFFGRDSEQALIIANLIASRLTLVFGPSGVGKSSLLRAGVAPALRRQAQAHLATSGTPESAVVVFSAWRDDPVAGLVEAVHASVRQAWDGHVGTAPTNGSTPHGGHSGRRGLVETLESCAEFIDGELIIILDQFEEYFLYHGHEDGAATFAGEFARAVSSARLRASFLVAIREDALAKLDRFEGHIPNLFTNYLRIEHLDRASARAAIERPIERYNFLLPADERAARVGIEPDLVDAVLDQVRMGQVLVGETGRGIVDSQAALDDDAAAERIETPYLQLVMTRLWREDVLGAHQPTPRLSRATLDRLGGAEQIVRTHLDATMSALSTQQRDVAARVFHYLVTPSGSKIAHSAEDLADYTGIDQFEVREVLESLSGAGARVLLPIAPPVDQPDVVRYEIFHDVLGAPVLDWRTRYAQAQEREAAQQQLARERRRVWRLRAGLIGVSVLLLGVVALAIFAVQQRDAARTAERIASSRGVAATALAQQTTQPELSLLLAIEAAQSAQTSQTEDALRSVVLDPSRAVLRGHTGAITAVNFSPTGDLVVTAGQDRTARLWDTRTGALLAELAEHTRPLTGAAFSPDGQRVVTTGEDNIARIWDVGGRRRILQVGGHGTDPNAAFSDDGTLLVTSSDTSARVWDTRDGHMVADLRGHIGLVTDAALRGDGQQVVTASRDGTARIWDARSGEVLATLSGHNASVESAAFSPDGRWIVTASRDGTARVWEGATGRTIAELRGHAAAVTSASFSPDGTRVLTASEDTTARLWDAATGRRLAELTGHGGFVTSARFSRDGRSIVTASSDKLARIWAADRHERIAELRGHAATITSATFAPNASLVLTGSDDGTARLWSIDAGQSRAVLRGHTNWITSATLAPNGTRVLTASLDGLARIWNATTGEPLSELRGHAGLVNNAVFSANGTRVATASDDHTARIWDADTGQALVELKGHTGSVSSIAFSPDGEWIVTASLDTTARVWGARSGAPAAVLSDHAGPVESATFSRDSRWIVTASRDSTARLWQVGNWQSAAELRGHRGSVIGATFSSDGSLVATASSDGTARVWEAPSGRGLFELRGHAQELTAIAFSPDSRQLVTASEDGTARLWDARSGRSLLALQGHSAAVTSAVFSADGKFVLTGSEDDSGRVWETATGRVIAELRGHTRPLTSAAFGPANSLILTASRDGTARLYDCAPCGSFDQLFELARARATRALTLDERRAYLDER